MYNRWMNLNLRKSGGNFGNKKEPFSRLFVFFEYRLLQKASFKTESYIDAMDRAQEGDVIYCDPPYTHSQSIIYGAQAFDVNVLFEKIAECKARGVKVILSINGMRDSKKKDISITPPEGLFERKLLVNCGTSMIDRLQNTGKKMKDKKVDDQLLLTW